MTLRLLVEAQFPAEVPFSLLLCGDDIGWVRAGIFEPHRLRRRPRDPATGDPRGRAGAPAPPHIRHGPSWVLAAATAVDNFVDSTGRHPHPGATRWDDVARLLNGQVGGGGWRSEEHTSELQSRGHLVCRLLLEKKKNRRPSLIK